MVETILIALPVSRQGALFFLPLRAKFGGHRCTAFVRCPGRTTLEYLNPFQSNLCPHRSQNFMYSRSRDIEQRGQIGNVMPSFKSMTSATGIGTRNPTIESG